MSDSKHKTIHQKHDGLVTHSANDSKVNKTLIFNTAWVRNQWAIILMSLLVLGSFGFIVYSKAAPSVIAKVEAEQMTLPDSANIVKDATASRGQAVRMSRGSLTGLVNLPASATSLNVSVRSNSCRGLPSVNLTVDGLTVIKKTTITSRGWKAFSGSVALAPGTHKVAINYSTASYCLPFLYVDAVTFFGNSSTAPTTPTVALSSSPVTLSAGGSSTLTWTSTNSTSCVASGGWSGPQATGGSISTGALNSNTAYTLTCTGPGGSATASANVSVVPVSSTGGSGGSTSNSGAYGTQLASDSLGNLEIGKAAGRQISYRFRATHTGPISNIGVFFIYRAAGYYSGNGGSVRVALQTDDGSTNHLPSGTVLAAHNISDPMSTPFRNFNLDSAASLTSGQLYHLVFTNTDNNPLTNWVSVDDMYQYTPGTQMQPTVSDTDLAVVWKYEASSSWEVNRNHTPIYVVRYQDGATQGMGYIDAISSSGAQSIGGSNFVEQTMKPSSNRSVTKVAFRLAKTGSSDLKIELKQGSTTLSTVSVPASSISSSNNWVLASLPVAINLVSGTSYSLVLSSATASYSIFPLQEGTSYGLTGGNNFTDGMYMFSTNSGSSYQTLNSRSDYDLQFYLQ